MRNKKSIITGLVVGAMLLTGATFAAADDAPLGLKMTGEGLGQGETKYFISDFLLMEPIDLRLARRAGNSMVAVAESQGVPGAVLINAVVDYKINEVGVACEVEDVRAKVTANLTAEPVSQGQAAQVRAQQGEHVGEPVENQMNGQARGWK